MRRFERLTRNREVAFHSVVSDIDTIRRGVSLDSAEVFVRNQIMRRTQERIIPEH